MTTPLFARVASARQALVTFWDDQLRWLIPVDPRGIVLGCACVGLTALGLVALINSDPLGWADLAGAVLGALFIQTQLVTTFLWLLFAAGGLWAVTMGGTAGWVEVALGLSLVGVGLVPVTDPELYPPLGASRTDPQSSLSPTSTAIEVSRPALVAPVAIRTLGRLQIMAGTEDLAPVLLDKRILGFLWCWLLAAALRTPDGAVNRAEMAAELSASPNRRVQLERLRRQVWDLQHSLPGALAAMVSAERNTVRVDLSQADCDLIRLRRLSDEASGLGDSDDRVEALQAALDAIPTDRFLPEFEQLARAARHNRGSGMQAVDEVRTWVLRTRMNAAGLLARRPRQLVNSKE